jgi:hypothetical protein
MSNNCCKLLGSWLAAADVGLPMNSSNVVLHDIDITTQRHALAAEQRPA